jgi:hypothetical protein
MFILVALLMGWTPSWGEGTTQGWVDIACENEEFNGVSWQPFYSEPENVSVRVERRGQTVRIELWQNKPRALVAADNVECNDA